MKGLRAWALRLRGLWPNERRERELADEIEAHLQLHIDDNLRTGMSPELARRNAILKLGGVESTKRAYRDGGTIPFLEDLLQDVRFSMRQLRKNLGFTSTAILMLTLGMCASVAIFAFVDGALIKPLPYQNPGRLVGVYESAALCPQCNLSYPDYLDWKRLNTAFTSLAAYQRAGFLLTTREGSQAANGIRVTDGFFRTLGVNPVLGRDFRNGEDLPSAARTVILSYAVWRKKYGGRTDVLGQTVTLNGEPNIVIGVLPRDFHFAPAEPAEFWSAFHAFNECDLRRSCHGMYGVARLKDGISLQSALSNVTVIAQQLAKQYPGSNLGQGASLMPLTEVIVGNLRPILLVLLCGAGLLLLIACVNIASLLLVRAESRKREMAVRSAMGASLVRLVRQFVTEGLVLTAVGSMLGLASGYWAVRLLSSLVPADMMASMPALNGLGLNLRVVTYAGVLSLVAAVLFSITPVLHLSFSGMRAGLTEGSRGSTGNTWRRIGSKLVVLELATAMVLLVGAGLLGKSFYRLLHVDLGLVPDHLATLQVAAPLSRYQSDDKALALARQVVSRTAALPGINSVGICSQLPVSFNGNTDWIRFVGRPYHGEHNDVNARDVSAGYFTTVGAKLERGRYFTDSEDTSKPKVVIINQELAREYFPGQDPIGKQIGDDDLTPKSLKEIIGIVDDIREGPLDSAIRPAVYYPFNQNPTAYFAVVVRTSQTEQSVLPELTNAVHLIDRDIVTAGARSMTDTIRDAPSTYLHRSSAWLVGGFAAVALLLGVLGLYGVVTYSVSQRTREIGVRMALGAQQGTVYRLVLNEAGRLTAFGIAVGLLCSLAGATLMQRLLFDVHSWDVPTLLAVAALLGISALLASYIPARRAASVNPVEALRAE